MKNILFIIIFAINIYSKPLEVLIFDYPPLQGASAISDIGLAPEVVKAAFEENNIQVVFKTLPTLRAVDQIKKGNSLAMIGLSEHFEKSFQKNLTIFPILHMDFLIFYNRKTLKNFQYKEDEDLKKYNIGVLLNGGTHTYAKLQKLNVEGVPSLDAIFKKIKLGRNQIGVSEYLSGLNTIHHLFPGEENDWVAYTEKPFLSTIGGVIFNKYHKDYAIYEPVFRSGLIKIVKNGKWESILKKYYPKNKVSKNSIELIKEFVNKNTAP